MDSTSINYWAVLVAGVAYMVLGGLWYSSTLFGKVWMKGIGKTQEQIAESFSAFSYVVALVTSFVASYGVARIMLWTGSDSAGNGAMIGALAGVCFVLTSFVVGDAFEGRPRSLTIVNSLYHLVGLVVAGIIIGAWR